MADMDVRFNGEVGNIESNINKVDSFDENISGDAAKVKYPSVACLKDMVHIIETGEEGMWRWRKWSDGTAECWGWGSVSNITTTALRGTYYYSTEQKISYPKGLFTSAPIPTVSLRASVGFAIPAFTNVGVADSVGYWILTPNEALSNISVMYAISAIGSWK